MQFAVRIFNVCVSLPDTAEGRIVKGQLLRSGTSVAAQHREACRARSGAEFVSKIQSSQQELDETDFWLEFIERTGLLPAARLIEVRREANELMAIFSSSAKTAKASL
jgi:four helix bundle protein